MREVIDIISKYFQIGNDVTVPVVVTLLLFLLGLILNTIYSTALRYTNRKISKTQFLKFHKEVLKQSKYYEDAYKIIEKEDIENYVIKYQNITSIEVFSQIGYEKLFNSYFSGIENIFYSKRKLKAFSSFIEVLEYVNRTHKPSIDDLIEYNSKINELTDLRNKAVTAVMWNLESFHLKFHRQLTSEEAIGRYYNKTVTFIEELKNLNLNQNLDAVEACFQNIKSINNSDIDFMRKYDGDLKGLELNFLINESSMTYHNLKRYIKLNATIYKNLSAEYKLRSKQLLLSYGNLHGNGFLYIKNLVSGTKRT